MKLLMQLIVFWVLRTNGPLYWHIRKGKMSYSHYSSIIISIVYRVQTRAVDIPFELPIVAPITDEEQDACDGLDHIIHTHQASTAIGWAIKQRKVLLEERNNILALKKQLRGCFQGRSAQNWAILLFFGKQVYSIA